MKFQNVFARVIALTLILISAAASLTSLTSLIIPSTDSSSDSYITATTHTFSSGSTRPITNSHDEDLSTQFLNCFDSATCTEDDWVDLSDYASFKLSSTTSQVRTVYVLTDSVDSIEVYVSNTKYTLHRGSPDILCYSGVVVTGLISCTTVTTGQYIKVTGTTNFLKWFELYEILAWD